MFYCVAFVKAQYNGRVIAGYLICVTAVSLFGASHNHSKTQSDKTLLIWSRICILISMATQGVGYTILEIANMG